MGVRQASVLLPMLAAASLLLGACSGGGAGSAQSEFAAACIASGNLDARICECMAELAPRELTPDGLQLLIAGLVRDAGRVAELRRRISPQDAMQAGMFMVNAPGRCASQLSDATTDAAGPESRSAPTNASSAELKVVPRRKALAVNPVRARRWRPKLWGDEYSGR